MHPYLLHLGHLYLPTFAALVVVGLLAALLLSLRTAGLAGVDADALWNAGLFAILSAYVLSRGLLMLAHWSAFRAFPWLLLAVPSVTPAGVALTAAATLIWLRLQHMTELRALDAWAPCAALAWMFVALGQLAAGLAPEVPGAGVLEQPALYAALAAVGIAALTYVRLNPERRPGETAGLTLALGGLVEFLLTLLREPSAVAWLGLEQGQWLSLAELAGGGCLIAFAPQPELSSPLPPEST